MATQVGCPFGPERTSSVYRWQSTLIPSRRIVHILCDDSRWLQRIPHIVADWRPLPHQGMGNQRQRFLEAGHVTFLDTCSPCADCGALLQVKAHASRSLRTLFGTCKLDSPRLEHCDCTRHKTSSCRPLSALLTESVAPELLSMEAKWSSLVSYCMSLAALQAFCHLSSPWTS